MYRIYLYKAGLFAFGVALLILGIVIVVQRELLLTPLAVIGGTVLLLHGMLNAINYITKQGKLKGKRKKALLFTALINTALGVVVLLLPRQTFRLFIFVFALYVLLNAASKIADFVICKKDRLPGGWVDLLAAAIYLSLSVILLGTRLRNDAFLIVSGAYCILFGATNLIDFLYWVFPQKAKNDLKRKIRISLPVFISTFIPLNTLRRINEHLSVNDELPPLTLPDQDDAEPPDLEVMVHVSNNGAGKIGHLDLYIDGEVVSYGNHDWSSHKLFGVFGDGILFTAEKDRYLDFSVTHDRKMIFSYGFRLTPEQLAAVRQEIVKLKSLAIPWKPPYQLAYEENPDARLADFHDYCSKLWAGTRADFFKFKKGKFKTYSILSTNCVLLTDEIIGKTGADIVFINGIASPGIYYDYLEKLYMTQNSMVVSKTIYDRKSVRRSKQERKKDEAR
ncbi:MAG: DUF308 domain-containing protein [Bacteroides sp.]|nr:DUF308 domain-containing protein [Eubacterium sp.]MCM1419055.1 DUF308 domain-containing protein [Roseburia sp.]MCM1461758.1 DUF308 domain-containing protein [Bacteroides sp.]